MQSMQSMATWQTLVKNIGKKFSGFSNTYRVAILMFVYILEEMEMESLGMAILIARDLHKWRSFIGHISTIGGCAISWKANL